MAERIFTAHALPVERGEHHEPATDSVARSQPPRAQPLDTGVFAALVIALVALLLWGLTQTWLLTAERTALQRAIAGQQQQIDTAGKLRAQLDAIAAGMQRLANGGNTSARVVVDELRKRGVTINVGSPDAGPR